MAEKAKGKVQIKVRDIKQRANLAGRCNVSEKIRKDVVITGVKCDD